MQRRLHERDKAPLPPLGQRAHKCAPARLRPSAATLGGGGPSVAVQEGQDDREAKTDEDHEDRGPWGDGHVGVGLDGGGRVGLAGGGLGVSGLEGVGGDDGRGHGGDQ